MASRVLHVRDDLRQLIQAKVARQEIVAPPAAEAALVVNLMDALAIPMR